MITLLVKPVFLLYCSMVLLPLLCTGCDAPAPKINVVQEPPTVPMPDTLGKRAAVDTSLSFAKLEDLYAYHNLTMKKVYDQCQAIRKQQSNGNFVADSLYAYNQELFFVLLYKNLLRFNKSEKEFFALYSLFDLSNLLTYEQKKDLFMQFPEKLRNSDKGKKTWAVLHRSTAHLNKNFANLPDLLLTDNANHSSLLKDLLPPNGNTLLVFGATWCAPCAYQDKKIEHYITDNIIDTTQLRIIYISVDENRKKWLESLQTKPVAQRHYNHALGIKGSFFASLGITGIPHYILLNSQQTIIREGIHIDPLLPYLKKKNGQ